MASNQTQTGSPEGQQREVTDFERLLNKNADALSRIDQIAGEKLLFGDQAAAFRTTLTIAARIQELRGILTDELMAPIMALQGTELGFTTDRDRPPKKATPEERKNWRPGYPVKVVRDVLIQATIRGLRLTNQEVCIIAGKLYAAKNGLRRQVLEYPGLTMLELKPGMIQQLGKGALVAFDARCTVNGETLCWRFAKEGADDTRIPVKTDEYLGADGILGKAERKVLARIYNQLIAMSETIPAAPLVAEEEPTNSEDLSGPQPADSVKFGHRPNPLSTQPKPEATGLIYDLNSLKQLVATAQTQQAIKDVFAHAQDLPQADFSELTAFAEVALGEMKRRQQPATGQNPAVYSGSLLADEE